MREIYRRADAAAAARPELFCRMSGLCCRFREAGHALFCTALEYAEMEREGKAPEGDAEAACPWLESGLCGNREGRALGCRTYFCSDEAAAAELTERFHGEIRRVHERYGLPYRYASLADHVRASS